MLTFQYCRDQIILAPEMLIQCSFGSTRRIGDSIYAGAYKAALVEKGIGGIDDTLTGFSRFSAHGVALSKVY